MKGNGFQHKSKSFLKRDHTPCRNDIRIIPCKKYYCDTADEINMMMGPKGVIQPRSMIRIDIITGITVLGISCLIR